MYNVQGDGNDRDGEGLVLVLRRLPESRTIAPPENPKFHENGQVKVRKMTHRSCNSRT